MSRHRETTKAASMGDGDFEFLTNRREIANFEPPFHPIPPYFSILQILIRSNDRKNAISLFLFEKLLLAAIISI